jgi:hypothetical protein
VCRLRTNFARLGDPLQGLHNRNAPLFPYGDFPRRGKFSRHYTMSNLS